MICIFSLGCKVNSYESDVLRAELENNNLQVTTKLQKADIYVINTCAVTNEAERKSRQCITRVLKLNPCATVYVMGCASQKNAKQFENCKNVKFITGNKDKQKIAQLILNKCQQDLRLDDFNISDEYIWHNHAKQSNIRAYVKIQDGCNNFCSYCIIPYLRGRSRSRQPQDIIDEVKHLEQQGVKEIVLTGIDMSDYKINGEKALGQLISMLDFYDGRIRIGSLEVGIVTPEFVKTIKNVKNLCPQFHLSLQSGSDTVLKSMNRKYTTKQYEDAVNLLRKNFVSPAITTDLIVGFPTETEQEFQTTFNFIKKIGFAQMHIFPYSNREGTVASKMYKTLDGKIINNRLEKAETLAKQMQTNYIQQNYNKPQRLLIEESINDYFFGYTDNYIKIKTKSKQNIGQFCNFTLGKDKNFEVILKG